MLRIKKKKTGSMPVIVPWDPAIDTKKSNLKEYLQTLDQSHLSFVAGKDPSVIHITTFPQWVVAKLMKTDYNNAQATVVSCFCYSVEKIDNPGEHLLTDSVEMEGATGTWIPTDRAQGPSGELIPCIDEDFALTAFNMQFMTYISSIVQKRAFLHPGTSKPYAGLLSFYLPTTEEKASK